MKVFVERGDDSHAGSHASAGQEDSVSFQAGSVVIGTHVQSYIARSPHALYPYDGEPILMHHHLYLSTSSELLITDWAKA